MDLQGRANSVSQVDGVSDMAPLCWLYGSVTLGGRSSVKGRWPRPPFCLEESCPPSLSLMPDTSVSPYMPPVPFKLLPQCWSLEGVSLSKSLCGFFKRNFLGLQKFLLPT